MLEQLKAETDHLYSVFNKGQENYRSMYDEVVKEVQKNHPDIKIITKELD